MFIGQVLRFAARNVHHCTRLNRSAFMCLMNKSFSTSQIRTVINVDLTSVRYPHIHRSDFSELNKDDIAYFESLLSPSQILQEQSELDGFNIDWMRHWKGASSLVLKPKTTEQVSEIVKYCYARSLAIVPQGGNTGLVGGSVPVFDEIIISTQLLNQVINLDEISGVLICQSGCVLETLDNYLADYSLMMPLDLGAKASCHIGGNVSTCAGGLRLLRYGSLHGNVLGLEAVLGDGEILDCMSTVRKDNTGYDMKQLLIGSEGTLGIVTKVAILCPRRSSAINVAFLGCEKFSDVLKTLSIAKRMLGEILSAFEMEDSASMHAVTKYLHLKNPISDNNFYILVETSGSKAEHDEEKLNEFLEVAMNEGCVVDGTVAQDSLQQKALWSLRERIVEALMHEGYTYKYDVSIPTPEFYNLVVDMRERLGDSVLTCCGYGHLGDGNLHLNLTSPQFDKSAVDKMEPYVFEWVCEKNGSISAEHGMGLHKKDFMYYSKKRLAVDLMKDIKKVMDPKGILNPYKTLPDD